MRIHAFTLLLIFFSVICFGQIPVIDSISIQHQSCRNVNNGSLTIHASGGYPPYQYSINSGQDFSSDSTFHGLYSRNYGIVVRDFHYQVTDNEYHRVRNIFYDRCDNIFLCNPTGILTAPEGYLWYNWSDGIQSASATRVVNAPGSYTVTVTGVGACTETIDFEVYEDRISFNPDTVVECGPLELKPFDNIDSCAWLDTNGNILSNNSAFYITGPGTGSYYFTANDINGCCLHSDTFNVDIIKKGANNNWMPDTIMGCAPLPTNFIEINQYHGQIYEWDFGDGDTTVLFSNTGCFHVYDTPGTFDVCLSVIDTNGCRNTKCYNDLIRVFEVPVADFSFDYNASEVTFINHTPDIEGCWWRYGDNTELCITYDSSFYSYFYYKYDITAVVDSNLLKTHKHVYRPHNRNYRVEFFVITDHGCRDTVYKTVSGYNHRDNHFMIYPNPFQDEIKLEIDKCDDENVKIRVYNNIGQIVYESDFIIEYFYNEINLPLWSLKNGIYIFEVSSTNLFYREKLIKYK